MDRRAHPRFPLILAVQHLGAESGLGYTENLSASGIFIRTEREFRIGERVQLVVSFPQLLAPVELEVEVTRVEAGAEGPAGVAVVVPPDRTEDLHRLGEIASQLQAAARAPEPEVRILVAEDNKLVASMYEAALHKLAETGGVAGIGIEVARDGEEAFARLLRPPRIDLIVTDVHMPVLTGVELVERIRGEPSLAQLPVVAISSAGATEQQALARLGVTLFLRKPVRYADLAGTVRFLLNSRRNGPGDAPPRSTPQG
ncbi:MAG TPA: response regulator [Anaeromyxobacteraceae bacterium]|nr:response regulator [Anaeromyxobacteraceae bacterium]